MEIREAISPEQWDAFVASKPESQFLQSYALGEFQKEVGRRAVRIAVAENGNILGVAQCIFTQHGLGVSSFALYRGPIIDQSLSPNTFQECFHKLMSRVVEVGRECRATYIHWEPTFAQNSPEAVMAKGLGGWVSVGSSQPRDSLLLRLVDTTPLRPPPTVGGGLGGGTEGMLSRMHEKTRYNIRLAERKGVRVEHGTSPEFIENFLRLSYITAKREKIHIHSDAYYRKMIEVLGEKGMVGVWVAFLGLTPAAPSPFAESNGEGVGGEDRQALAVNIVISFGDTMTYVHGASSNENRNLMAPHLLQWKQIEWAVEQGRKWYDFWGIAPNDDPKHPWAGITRFKRGFGGEEQHYDPARDLPIAKVRYNLVRLRRKLR